MAVFKNTSFFFSENSPGWSLMDRHESFLETISLFFTGFACEYAKRLGVVLVLKAQWGAGGYCPGEVTISMPPAGDDAFRGYKGTTIGVGFKWNILKVGNVSAVCLGTMLNYTCCQLLFLG